jgi:hypothetical protein
MACQCPGARGVCGQVGRGCAAAGVSTSQSHLPGCIDAAAKFRSPSHAGTTSPGEWQQAMTARHPVG